MEFVRPRLASRFEPTSIRAKPSVEGRPNSEAYASTVAGNESHVSVRKPVPASNETIYSNLKSEQITHEDNVASAALYEDGREKKSRYVSIQHQKERSILSNSQSGGQNAASNPEVQQKQSEMLSAKKPIISRRELAGAKMPALTYYSELEPTFSSFRSIAQRIQKPNLEISTNPFEPLNQEAPLLSKKIEQRAPIDGAQNRQYAPQNENSLTQLFDLQDDSISIEAESKGTLSSQINQRKKANAMALLRSEELNESIVEVNIGRVEVQASLQPLPQARRPSPWSPKLSLDDYLKRRKEW